MIDDLIETGNSERILQKAIQEMGRGQVYVFSLCFTMIKVQWCNIDFWCWVVTILGDGYIERDSRKAWYCQGNWKETSWTPSSIWFLNFQTSQLHFIKHILMFTLWLNHVVQVFMDMAVLVEAQGEMLDNIETQVWQRTNTYLLT